MASRGSAAEAAYGPSDEDLIARATDTIWRTAAAVATYRGIRAEDIAKALRISKATAYRKLNGSSEFTAGELWPLSILLGVSLSTFFTGILQEPTTQAPSPERQIFNDPGIGELESRRARRDAEANTRCQRRDQGAGTENAQVIRLHRSTGVTLRTTPTQPSQPSLIA